MEDQVTNKANTRQVGGSHYGLSKFQHWDLVEQFGMGYLESCASKYLVRWRDKGGIQDLEKADHYVQKLIEIGRKPRGRVTVYALEKFFEDNDTRDGLEAACLRVLCNGWNRADELELVRGWIAELKAEANKERERKMGFGREPDGGMKYPFGYDPDLDNPL